MRSLALRNWQPFHTSLLLPRTEAETASLTLLPRLANGSHLTPSGVLVDSNLNPQTAYTVPVNLATNPFRLDPNSFISVNLISVKLMFPINSNYLINNCFICLMLE